MHIPTGAGNHFESHIPVVVIQTQLFDSDLDCAMAGLGIDGRIGRLNVIHGVIHIGYPVRANIPRRMCLVNQTMEMVEAREDIRGQTRYT